MKQLINNKVQFIHTANLFLFIIFIYQCCSPKSEQDAKESYHIALIDSLVINELSVMSLDGISPDGKKFALYEHNTRDIIISDKNGSIISRFNRSVDGPESYGRFKISKILWLNNDELLVMSQHGLFVYNTKGILKEKIIPPFTPSYRYIVPGNNNAIILPENKILLLLQGRYDELGMSIRHQQESKQLEIYDRKERTFEAVLPFPDESKFRKELLYEDVGKFPIMASNANKVWVSFANEPKIYEYNITNLISPIQTIALDLNPFYEAEGKAVKEYNKAQDLTALFFGQMGSLHQIADNQLLLYYRCGIPHEKTKELYAKNKGNFDDYLMAASSLNSHQFAIIQDGKLITEDVEKNEKLNIPLFTDSNGMIWFSATESENEKDYNVFYQTKLIKKQ